jgi:hypothetical protein
MKRSVMPCGSEHICIHAEQSWSKDGAKAYMATFQRARFERTLKPRAAQPDDAAADTMRADRSSADC